MKKNKNGSRTQNTYEIKVKENYNVIDKVRGNSISEALYKTMVKHCGGIQPVLEHYAEDFAIEWNKTFSPEAFRDMLRNKEQREEEGVDENVERVEKKPQKSYDEEIWWPSDPVFYTILFILVMLLTVIFFLT